MAVLSFTLSPEALGKFYDALVCLGKFSETVSLEATNDKLLLTTLNSSKSAYASFTLIGKRFFLKYQYQPLRRPGGQSEKFSCKIYNKALLSVFKGRVVDPTRDKETAVERCDITIEDRDEKAKNRVIIKMTCRHGVHKTFRLTFESAPPVHALFTKESAKNRWSISSKPLRELAEHFGPGTEQLDIYSEDGRISFTSFTEKIVSNNEVLKQPLHTTIAIDSLEFTDFSVEEGIHIVFSVKDFKSIIAHAGITNIIVQAGYSHPSSPMQLAYSEEGMSSEFILMTIGEPRASSVPVERGASRGSSKRAPSRHPLEAASNSRKSSKSSAVTPAPTGGAVSFSYENAKRVKVFRPSLPPQSTSGSLMFPPADDDRHWDPVNYDDEDEPDLLWDVNNHVAPNVGSVRHVQSLGAQAADHFYQKNEQDGHLASQRLAPTQRLSEIKGIFDT